LMEGGEESEERRGGEEEGRRRRGRGRRIGLDDLFQVEEEKQSSMVAIISPTC